jgi:phospholipid/cholesterol/gamma-HCH transport system substrate-binding protein
MKRNTIETVMGAVVLLVAGGFLWLAYTATGVQSSSGTRVMAQFGNIGGLGIGDDVQVSGITIGRVIATELDKTKFSASVTMAIDESVSLPSDSAARIVASSLLGGNHIEILPGFEDDFLMDGDMIYDTRDPVSLTDLIGKAVFSTGAGSDG